MLDKPHNIGNNAEDWDSVASNWSNERYSSGPLAKHHRKVYLDLVQRWTDFNSVNCILKTDLFAEAFGPELFLFDLAEINGNIFAVDTSREIVNKAIINAKDHKINTNGFLQADVRCLPFENDKFDLIISDSTLDHFSAKEDIFRSLAELTRVLKPGGTFILTLDNKRNLTYPPYPLIRLWMKLRLSPYFIGRTLSLAELEQALEPLGMKIITNTVILHLPHPDGLVRWVDKLASKTSKGRLDKPLFNAFCMLDKLEKLPTRSLTGRYLAIKAIKT